MAHYMIIWYSILYNGEGQGRRTWRAETCFPMEACQLCRCSGDPGLKWAWLHGLGRRRAAATCAWIPPPACRHLPSNRFLLRMIGSDFAISCWVPLRRWVQSWPRVHRRGLSELLASTGPPSLRGSRKYHASLRISSTTRSRQAWC